jgi:hypothetical protein
MRVRRLDNEEDWSFGRGLNSYANNSEAIAQCVKTRLLSLHNDWFLNRDDGVKWFNYLCKKPDLRTMEVELKSTVLNTYGVETILNFDIKIPEGIRTAVITVGYLDRYGSEKGVTTNAPYYQFRVSYRPD